MFKPGRHSIDAPADEDDLKTSPSPTLSTQSSVHFKTSTALRENEPGDGSTRLTLLSRKDNPRSHSQRPSNTTTASTDEGMVTDHSPGLSHLYAAASDVTTVRSAVGILNSPTPTQVGPVSNIGDSDKRKQKQKSGKKAKGNAERTPEEGDDDDEDDEGKPTELDLTQDKNIDPTPFAFKPYRLASLVNPKNLETLEAMGGIDGLLVGLGVGPTNGLSIGGKSSKTLPVCKSKSLLQLMRLALEEKVLILLSVVAIVSLALGSPHNFGPAHVPGESLSEYPSEKGIAFAIKMCAGSCIRRSDRL